jgi:low affinity Fe/Cu permease
MPSEHASADVFRHFAVWTANAVGNKWAFVIAVAAIVVWAITGPIFHFSDTWQLVINTATTIVTFLMVFLIQNTQNRDAKAIHLKLDELLRAVKGARNRLVNLEELSDAELKSLHNEFERVRARALERPTHAPRHVAERTHDAASRDSRASSESASSQGEPPGMNV